MNNTKTTIKIGIAICFLRHQNKLTQKELAIKAGVAQDYISKLESGKKNPTIETLENIISPMNTTLSKFFSKVESIPDVENNGLFHSLSKLIPALEGIANSCCNLES